MSLKLFEIVTRLSFFFVYFWFGILKVLDLSSASPLVNDLAAKTLPFIPQDTFFIILGASEIIIGVMFLIKRITKITIFITSVHLFATMLPLFLLPQHTWLTPGVFSMEGQYIFKNLFIFSSLVGLYTIENLRDSSLKKVVKTAH